MALAAIQGLNEERAAEIAWLREEMEASWEQFAEVTARMDGDTGS